MSNSSPTAYSLWVENYVAPDPDKIGEAFIECMFARFCECYAAMMRGDAYFETVNAAVNGNYIWVYPLGGSTISPKTALKLIERVEKFLTSASEGWPTSQFYARVPLNEESLVVNFYAPPKTKAGSETKCVVM